MRLTSRVLVPREVEHFTMTDLYKARLISYGSEYVWTDKERIQTDQVTFSDDKIREIFNMIDKVKLNSSCQRAQIGCAITDYQLRVLATGYNKKPRNYDDVHPISKEPIMKCVNPNDKDRELGCQPEVTCRLTTHAEVNAFSQIPEYTGDMIVFCSAVPCLDCMKVCHERGVRLVLYKEERPQPELDRPSMSWMTVHTGIIFLKVSE